MIRPSESPGVSPGPVGSAMHERLERLPLYRNPRGAVTGALRVALGVAQP
jgi:hypothetical protein